MIRIMPKRANMYDSTAHVFVKFFSIENRHFDEVHCGKFGGLKSSIKQAVNKKDIRGRLWIRPGKLSWPKSMGENTPNGAPDRTVWHVMIPRGCCENQHATSISLQLLAQWLTQTGLPLRVAIYNDGLEEKIYPNYISYDSELDKAVEVFRKYLDRWEVEVYQLMTLQI